MRRSIGLALVAVLMFESLAFAGLGARDAMYVGGTINTIKEKTEGKISTADEKEFLFETTAGKMAIPYSAITSLEYGQKAGRRVGATIGAAAALGVGALPLLFSKKRKHFLTIAFSDAEGKSQAAVLELGKDIIRPTLTILETRTGKKVEYQDEEARKTAAK